MKMNENKEERLENGDDYAVQRNDGTWRKLGTAITPLVYRFLFQNLRPLIRFLFQIRHK